MFRHIADRFKGLSLTISQKQVIVIGDITLYFYKQGGNLRVKIDAPKDQTITRVDLETFLQYKEKHEKTTPIITSDNSTDSIVW